MTIIRRALILIAVAWTVTGAAAAAEYRAFDQTAFAQAQDLGHHRVDPLQALGDALVLQFKLRPPLRQG